MIEHERRLNRRATPPPPATPALPPGRAIRVRNKARPTPAPTAPAALPPLKLPPRPGRAYFVAKRCIDVTATLIALTLLSPLLLLIALLIKLEDGGPVIFKQTRVGENGRLFPFYKFRSMRVDAEAQRAALLERWKAGRTGGDSVRFKLDQDPRVTRVGKWIRRFSVDEMPQLWNVLVGDMTLVGPRPPLPEEVALYGPRERLRLAAPQGLTCLWQVRGRSLIPFDRQVEMDVEYMGKRSVLFDLGLLLQTVPAVVGGRGAH